MISDNPPWVYTIGFIPARQISTKKHPMHAELVIRVRKAYCEWLAEVLASDWFVSQLQSTIGYLSDPGPYTLWEPGLLSFGYGSYRISHGGGEYWFHLPLDRERVEEVALNAHLLLKALFYILSTEDRERLDRLSDGRSQLLRVDTLCSRAEVVGHAVGGEAYAPFRAPLVDFWENSEINGGSYQVLQATNALEEAWHELVSKDSFGKPAYDLNVQLWRGGRFIVQIPNRVGLYFSDNEPRDPNCPRTITCGNTDSAKQQILLLCGLAGLLDWFPRLARVG